MAFCEKCGAKIGDWATLCPACQEDQTQATPVAPVKKKRKPTLWIILGAAVLLIGIISFVLFRPRNLKMNDFKDVGTVGAVINYGWPESFRTDEYGDTFLDYKNTVDFYGITPWSMCVYPEENKVVFFFHSSDGEAVYRIISDKCRLEDRGMNIFHKFRYDDMTITTYAYESSYVSIEFD